MRFLLLGAGGIGCEVLKILGTLQNIESIDVIDMDTIEVSNLHRQFLFHSEHVGQPKAIVAASAIEKLYPSLKGLIKTHVKNIFSLPLSLFESTNIVINALDNVEARSRVSLMCLLSKKILIDAGTAGLEGQVSSIGFKDRLIECFDCIPKKAYSPTIPVCTIRQTPTSFTHCIIWALEFLFNSLFSSTNISSIITSNADITNSSNIGDKYKDGLNQSHIIVSNIASADINEKDIRSKKLSNESNDMSLLSSNNTEYFLIQFRCSSSGKPADLLYRIFHQDIQSLIAIDKLWIDKKLPQPLSHDIICENSSSSNINDCCLNDIGEYETDSSTEKLVSVFSFYLEKLLKHFTFPLLFNKDDHDSVAFIHSAASIRAKIFGISSDSRFSVKAVAGQIIPAVVTTNAVAAGLTVLHALHLLNNDKLTRQTIPPIIYYAPYNISTKTLFLCERIQPPNKDCQTCSLGLFILSINSVTTALSSVIFLIEENIYQDKEFSVLFGENCIYDLELHSLMNRSLKSLDLKEGSILLILPEDYDRAKSLVYIKVDEDVQNNKIGAIISILPLIANNNAKKQKIPTQEEIFLSDSEDIEIL